MLMNCKSWASKKWSLVLLDGFTFRCHVINCFFTFLIVLTIAVVVQWFNQSNLFPEGNLNIIQVELKGPDSSLRVRQVRLLGCGTTRSFNASAIHQRTCETETLRVFRLLTSQVNLKIFSVMNYVLNVNFVFELGIWSISFQ